MTLSKLIAILQGALRKHGDLPVYTADADIAEVLVHPAVDGDRRSVDGIADDPNELVIELLPER